MINLDNQIKSQNIIYVTRDIERALGIKPTPENGYKIISNWSEYAEEVSKNYPAGFLLIKEDEMLDTWKLLEHKGVQDFIKKSSNNPKILVFKNTSKIEEICTRNSWELLNPKSTLANTVENKISQIEWLGDLSSLLPEHRLQKASEIEWNNKVFIIQWGQGHTGESSLLIDSLETLNKVKNAFPERIAKISEYIDGPVFTSNISIAKNKILYGNISYQITGFLPFTEKVFSTIGNDWSFSNSELDEDDLKQYNTIAEKVAEHMRKSGWLGLFGIDVIYDKTRKKIFLLEINARQPASVTYESELQSEIRELAKDSPLIANSLTMFEAHLLSVLGQDISGDIVMLNDGSQIIQRITTRLPLDLKHKSLIIKSLESKGFKVINYNNTKANADSMRIQSKLGIIEGHNKLNKRGEIIMKSIIEELND